MTETNVFELTQPGTFSDPLTEVLRNGARTLLGQAVEARLRQLSTHTDKLTDDGRRRLVRHGHLPEREIVTGIGAVAVRCPRVTASARRRAHPISSNFASLYAPIEEPRDADPDSPEGHLRDFEGR